MRFTLLLVSMQARCSAPGAPILFSERFNLLSACVKNEVNQKKDE
jgi:hypothetical protein